MSRTVVTSETLQSKAARRELTRILDQLMADPNFVFHVTRFGRPVAVILSVQAWEAMQGDHK